jgi:lipopolysaccharide/colanic/teichoic acid biosynthesis glycosyltransferase
MGRARALFLDAVCRVCDIVLVFLILTLTYPLFFIAILLVKFDSPGPLIFRQIRYGRNKRRFYIYKFRTMRVDSEKGTPVWGKERDPRATRLGNLLRATHVDELPQLFNVLNGDMRLVGPRPERPFFADVFEKAIPGYSERFTVKPGITGWAQINGLRSDTSIEKRTEYDRYYVRHYSVFFDLRILIGTLFLKPVSMHKHTHVCEPMLSFFPMQDPRLA